jgi:hypothetical protein
MAKEYRVSLLRKLKCRKFDYICMTLNFILLMSELNGLWAEKNTGTKQDEN